jgi:uncharacterized SAM-binding protein YcdF (DUF218 family)
MAQIADVKTGDAYDAILIPGGGVREGGAVPPWTQRRLEAALTIQTGRELMITLSAGTVYKPLSRDERGYPIFESSAAAAYLLAHGVAPRRILTETISYDTIGNAFFGRVIHVDPRRLRRLLIITSQFHMARTRAIFEWVFGLDPSPGGYDLNFHEVSDEGLDMDLLAARRVKEQDGLRKLTGVMERIHTLRDLHEWLFSEHAAYMVNPPAQNTYGTVLDSY